MTADFIPKNLTVNSWEDIKPFFDKLSTTPLETLNNLEDLIQYLSDVLSVYREQGAWACIRMTCHTDNEAYVKRLEFFETVIEPKVSTATDKINKKITLSPFFEKLPEARYGPYKRSVKRNVELFRESNPPLYAELSKLGTRFNQITGSLTVTIDKQELTLPQAQCLLESADREIRKNAWLAIQECRLKVKNNLDSIFNEMVVLRHQIALNAGYQNFRDYQHSAYHRFDYSPQDLFTLHESIKKHLLPLAKDLLEKKCHKLGLKGDFRPWDIEGEPQGLLPLRPFQTTQELIQKTITIFGTLKPVFGKNLKAMETAGLLDLETRKNKAPGGYNQNLAITGMPFIFMNSAGTHRDMITLMHEGGHAMHSFLTRDEPLIFYRNTPMEMSETASMGMELLTIPFWNSFYSGVDLKRAIREHLEDIVRYFLWFAIVDKFQHWIYLHPRHSIRERDQYYESLMIEFGTSVDDWNGFEQYRQNYWQKQLHIFENPFYYIEYAIAQLGALQIYRNYLQDREGALNAYIEGLKLGSSATLPEVWKVMKIHFDFSEQTVSEMMKFLKKELEEL